MRKRFVVVIGAAALGAAVMAAGASADFRSVHDPRGDAKCYHGHKVGRHKPCSDQRRRNTDIVRATAGHDGALLKHTIRVAGKFRSVHLLINTDSDPGCEWSLFVRQGEQPWGECFARDHGVIGHARVDFHRHSVEISFPKSSIGNPASYGWTAYTWLGGVPASAIDSVPNSRPTGPPHYIEHSLGDSGVAAAGATALGAQTAAAGGQQLSCGDTITTDTTLHKDLIDCHNTGIVIGADNVTLDLNGHTIDGVGARQHPVGVSFITCASGPVVSCTEADGITVKDGSIRQFGTGLDAFGSRQIRLLDLAVSQNQRFGITLAAADRILVRNCSADHTTGSTDPDGAGLLVTSASHHVRIVNSSFRHNASDGIRSIGTTDSVIERNLVSGNDDVAFHMEGGNHLQVRRNRLVRNGAGIVVDGSRNVIADNRITGGRDGVAINSGRGNVVAHNVVAGAATSIRIKGEFEPGRGGAANTVIRGNRLLRANRDGVLVELTAKDTLLRHNSARHSRGDGFDVNDRSTKLTKNRAVRNDDLGIEAVRGVRDGGGNVARHNGDPRQCTHVACD